LTTSLKKEQTSQKSDADKIRDFQRKIYLKAKQEKDFRFYVLYDKISSKRFLKEAYKRVKGKKGAAGVDGVTFKEIEGNEVEQYLREIQEELERKSYRPSSVKRVYIPKANGKERPLGIPTIKDRIVQMSCKLVIEPIFEADFEDSSYGFRPKRSASGAIGSIKKAMQAGKTAVLDADLSAYFDTIPHDKLMKTVAQRISDKNVLHLIKMWLKAAVKDERGGGSAKKNKIGTPQGGVISPLLANIYLNLVDRLVNKQNSIFQRNGIEIVRYADDFVLMGRKITETSLDKLKSVLERMELRMNEEKTKIVEAREESFDFLGFTIRYDRDRYGKSRGYWNIIPSQKASKKIREKIREWLNSNKMASPSQVAAGLNRIIRGWVNYFQIKGVSYPKKAMRDLRYYLREKLNRYYKRKSQRRSKLYRQGAFEVLVGKYGLIDPSKC